MMVTIQLQNKIKLIPSARVSKDKLTGRQVLLYPEGLLWLNDTAAEILSLCNGPTSVSSIVETIAQRYSPEDHSAIEGDVVDFLDNLFEHVLIKVEE